MPTNEFKQNLYDSLLKTTLAYQTIKITKNSSIYVEGDEDNTVYFIKTGQINLLVSSPQGKERILATLNPREFFGELSVGSLSRRLETAIAITDTQLITISSAKFLAHLNEQILLEGFTQYLAIRVAEQKHIIASLITGNN